MHTCSMAPHSLLAAESEDTTDFDGLPAEVPAVQTNSHRSVAEFTQRQGHGTEVQQAATEMTHTKTYVTLNSRQISVAQLQLFFKVLTESVKPSGLMMTEVFWKNTLS